MVAIYTPKGNVEGEFEKNVQEGDFDYNTMCSNRNNTLQVAKEIADNDKSSENGNAATNNSKILNHLKPPFPTARY